MKTVFFFLLFAVVSVVISMIGAPGAHAAPPTASIAATPAAGETEPQPEQYVLPFPGMLPTHPMYRLKTFRDSIIEWLIRDPVKKSEFYTLQADKRLNMGIFLLQQGNRDDMEQVAREAYGYRQLAVRLLGQAKDQGEDIPTHVIERLTLSVDKHAQVLSDLGMDPGPVRALLVNAPFPGR